MAANALKRALFVVQRIPRDRYVTVQDLHGALQAAGWACTERSVQRLMVELCKGFDIECDDRSRPHGYKWKPQAQGLLAPRLEPQAALLLRLAELQLSALLPPAVKASMALDFETAQRSLMQDMAGPGQRLKRWLGKILWVPPTIPLLPPPLAPGVLDAVSGALFADHWLDLHYRNARGGSWQHRVIPLGLAQRGERLFLMVRFEAHGDVRMLAVNRILEATDSGLPHPAVEDFSLQDFAEAGGFGFAQAPAPPVRIAFSLTRGSGQFLTESRLSPDQVCELRDERLHFQATVPVNAQLIWWLRAFGPNLADLAPPELAAQVHPPAP